MSQLEYRKKYKLITTLKYIHLQSLRLRIIIKNYKRYYLPFQSTFRTWDNYERDVNC